VAMFYYIDRSLDHDDDVECAQDVDANSLIRYIYTLQNDVPRTTEFTNSTF
jgi:hypothetical protein